MFPSYFQLSKYLEIHSVAKKACHYGVSKASCKHPALSKVDSYFRKEWSPIFNPSESMDIEKSPYMFALNYPSGNNH